MSVSSAQVIVAQFLVFSPTGALVNADSLPTSKVVLNGADNAATVTVANVTTGEYTASVTLPSLTAGDVVQIRVNATVAAITTAGIVWSDSCGLGKGVTIGAYVGNANAALNVTAAGIVMADVQTVLTHVVTVDANNAMNVSVKYIAGQPTGYGGAVGNGIVFYNAVGSRYELGVTVGGNGFADIQALIGTDLTETNPGQLASSFITLFDVATPTATADAIANLTNQTAIKTKTDFLPSVTAGAAGGVFIAGTNAATTIATSLTTHLIGTVDTVTTLTNLPTAPTDWLTGAAVKADAVTKIASGIWSMLTSAITAVGSIGVYLKSIVVLTAQQTADALKLAPTAGAPAAGSVMAELAALSAGSGSGAWAIVVPCQTLSAVAMQGVQVTLSISGLPYTAVSDSSGNATFHLDNGTYALSAFYPAYTFPAGSVVVAGGDATETPIVGTLVTVTPSTAPYCNLYFTALNPDGTPAVGAIFTWTQMVPPSGSGEVDMPGSISATADGSGLVQLPQARQGATGYLSNTTGGNTYRDYPVTLPASSSYALPNKQLK